MIGICDFADFFSEIFIFLKIFITKKLRSYRFQRESIACHTNHHIHAHHGGRVDWRLFGYECRQVGFSEFVQIIFNFFRRNWWTAVTMAPFGECVRYQLSLFNARCSPQFPVFTFLVIGK
jgi:hypothetical protein